MAAKKSSTISNINQIFKNDNTLKELGNLYKVLIALEKCLSAKPNQHIWIECKGDVATEDTSTEVKLHSITHNLTSNSEDAWKTVKNYVENLDIAKTFTHLILHTTSSIPVDSIFHNWNNLSAKIKLERLLNHQPTKSIQKYFDKVKACSEKDLKSILERFSISSEQPNIEEKWEEIKAHPGNRTIPEELRDFAMEWQCGYISKAAIDKPDMWQININDFDKDRMCALSEYRSNKMPFYVIEKPSINTDILENVFTFLSKMQEVKLKDKDQQVAYSDYIRAQESQAKMLQARPTLSKSFDIYDQNVSDVLSNHKSSCSYNLVVDDIGLEKAHKESRTVYFNCINSTHELIRDVSDTQKYYRDGRIHHITEHTEFEWKYSENDL